MLCSLLYDLLRLLIEILIVRGRGDAKLRAEVLALRQQLGVLGWQVGRPRWRPGDRLLLSAIGPQHVEDGPEDAPIIDAGV